VNSYTYTPFGELLTGEGAGFRFNGEYYDSATGYFAREIEYLREAGYSFTKNGDIWDIVKPH